MRKALLFGVLAVGLGAMALTRGGGPPVAIPPPPERVADPAPRPEPVLPPLPRNPFEYVPGPTIARAASPAGARRPVESAEVVAPRPPSLRLVGFVHQNERSKAILVLEGETVLLSVGESALGYELRRADESEGVRLIAPDGTERFLPLPE